MNSVFTTVLDSLRVLGADALAQVPQVVAGLILFLLFYVAGRVSRRLVRRALQWHDPTLAQMTSTLVAAGIFVLGGLVAFWIAIPTFKFTEIFTSLGVGGLILGFALRDLLENFAAGILILWRRPFVVGDQIRSGPSEGTVEEINFRATVLRAYDGVKVFLPNGQVFTQTLENFTAYPARRTTVVLGIDPGASVSWVRQVIHESLQKVAGILPEPPPMVLFDAVGAYTLDLHVLYWTAARTRMAELTLRSTVTEHLYEALTAAGVAFPYPTQTVRLANRLGAEASTDLRGRLPSRDDTPGHG